MLRSAAALEGARDGTLAIMVGGDEQAFERAQPVLQAMGTAVTHFGASGAGQAAKATNQILCAGVIQAVAEAMAFAKSEHLPLDRLIETLGKGAGSSWYFVNRAPNILRDSYPPGFRVRLHEKDLKICRAMAARHGVQLPLIEMTLVHYRRLIEQGHGDEDISTLFRLKDALFAARRQDQRQDQTAAAMRRPPWPRPPRHTRGSGARRLFLPDFCEPRAVLAVVLIAELVALVFALSRQALHDEFLDRSRRRLAVPAVDRTYLLGRAVSHAALVANAAAARASLIAIALMVATSALCPSWSTRSDTSGASACRT